MRTRLFSLLAVPLVLLAQCAPDGCAPAPAPPGDLRPGTTISIGQMQTFGFAGHLGADWLDARERQIRAPGGGYWALRNFSTSGFVDGGGVPVEPAGVEMARLEFYPDLIPGHWGSYDPWDPALTVGGLHLWNPDGRAVNGLQLPHASNGAVRYVAGVHDGGWPVADGRLRVQVFGYVNKDTTPGAFNVAANRGGQWTAGWIWPGTYEMFFYDDHTGRSIHATGDLRPEIPLTVDLSQPCFGVGLCTVLS
jgi:hypothetical protein